MSIERDSGNPVGKLYMFLLKANCSQPWFRRMVTNCAQWVSDRLIFVILMTVFIHCYLIAEDALLLLM